MSNFGNTQVTETPVKRPKTGGRRKGVPNKVTREIRELAQKYTLRAVRKVWKLAAEAEDQDTQLKAAALLLAYAHGKPTQRQELTGADGAGLMPISRIERVVVDASVTALPDHAGLMTGCVNARGVPQRDEAGPGSCAITSSSKT